MQSLENNTTVLSTPAKHQAFEELKQKIWAALETYSNVHRGTGHYSIITTELYEHAREIVLDYLGMDKKKYVVIFCSAYGSELLKNQLLSKDYQIISSHSVGLSLGIRAVVIKKEDLPEGIPFQTGGSVVKIASPDSVIWADAPQKFEAGTPAVINAITLAIALRIQQQFGNECFKSVEDITLSAKEILYRDKLSEYSGSQLMAELKKLLAGSWLSVPTAETKKPFINLDNAASTPTFFPIWDVVSKVLLQPERILSDITREVRKIISDFLNASPDNYETIFTGNTTEALNFMARLIQIEFGKDSGLVILNTLLEHNSNELPWRYIPGASLVRLSVDDEGFINHDELENILKKYNQENVYGKKRIRLVAISGASNVLGTFNDIERISGIVHKYGARILVDAAQLAAHRIINMEKWGIDYLAFSGHKIYAPFGSGALIIRKEFIHSCNSELEKIKTLEDENAAGIAALGKAVSLLQRIGMDIIENEENVLTIKLLKGLSGIKGIEIFGIKDLDSERINQKGGIISFRLKNVPHNLAAKELAELGGIGARNGCFCTHLLVKHLLKIHPARAAVANLSSILMPRLTKMFLPGLVRVSFGLENDENDVDILLKVLEKINNSQHFIINKLLALNGNGTPFISNTGVQKNIEEFLGIRLNKVYSICNLPADYLEKNGD